MASVGRREGRDVSLLAGGAGPRHAGTFVRTTMMGAERTGGSWPNLTGSGLSAMEWLGLTSGRVLPLSNRWDSTQIGHRGNKGVDLRSRSSASPHAHSDAP